MTAARAFGVEGVDRAASDGLERVLDKAAFVQRVGVDHHLHIHCIGNRKAAVDRARGCAPIFMQLHRTGAGQNLLFQGGGKTCVAFSRKPEVHRKGICRLHHPHQVPRARGAGGGKRAMRGAGATAKHGGDPGMQRVVDLLRGDEVDVGVHTPSRQDAAFAGDDLAAGSNDHIDARLGIGVPRLADLGDAAVAQADISLHDARVIDDQSICDDRIHRAFCARQLGLPHPVANDLATAELDLVAIAQGVCPAGTPFSDQVPLNLNDELGVAQPHLVAHRGAVHVGIGLPGNGRHRSLRACQTRGGPSV